MAKVLTTFSTQDDRDGAGVLCMPVRPPLHRVLSGQLVHRSGLGVVSGRRKRWRIRRRVGSWAAGLKEGSVAALV